MDTSLGADEGAGSMARLSDLPKEVLAKVLARLGPRDLANACCTCRCGSTAPQYAHRVLCINKSRFTMGPVAKKEIVTLRPLSARMLSEGLQHTF